MNSFLDEAQDAIVTDPERISISCLNQLQKISNSQNPAHVDQEFPNLPELNEAQVRDTQRFLSSNRALTEDGFSDAWIRRTQNTALISNLWRNYNETIPDAEEVVPGSPPQQGLALDLALPPAHTDHFNHPEPDDQVH